MSKKGYWTARSRHQLSRRGLLRGVGAAGIGLAGAALIGCGDDDDDDDTGAATQATAAPTQAAAGTTTAPARGGNVVLAESFDPGDVDPHVRGVTAPSMTMNDLVYETLVTFEPSLTEYKLAPQLADPPQQPDEITYIFSLTDANFHDVAPVNGRKLVASDVVESLLRIRDGKNPETGASSPWVFYLQATETIEAVDDKTVRIVNNKPFGAFLSYLGHRQPVIVPPEIFGQMQDQAAGTGPFIRTEFTNAVGAKFSRNPSYRRDGQPYLDSIEIPIITNPQSRLAAFRASEIDLFNTDQTAAAAVEGSATVWEVPGINPLGTQATGLVLNIRHEKLQDVRVRQAIQRAIDYDALMEVVTGGFAFRTGPISPFIGEWEPLKEDELPQLDLTKASQLMDAAGWKDGFDLDIVGSTARTFWGDSTVALVPMLAEININVGARPMDHSLWIQGGQDPEREGNVTYTVVEGPDPDHLFNVYRKRGKDTDGTWFNDDEIQGLLDKLRFNFDREERLATTGQVQRAIMDHASRYPMFFPIGYQLVQNRLQGFRPGFSLLGGHLPMTHANEWSVI